MCGARPLASPRGGWMTAAGGAGVMWEMKFDKNKPTG